MADKPRPTNTSPARTPAPSPIGPTVDLGVRQPWLKFYPSDWRADPKLRACSLGARGLWIEMLGLMHEASPRGFLLINGHPPNDIELARQVSANAREVRAALNELGKNDVFSITNNGVVFSRKMARDAQKSATNQRNGAKGAESRWGTGRYGERHREDDGDHDGNRAGERGGKTMAPYSRSQMPDAKDPPLPPNSGEEVAALEARFEQFWSAYPKKQARMKALECWRKKIRPDQQLTDRIIAAVEHQKHSAQWKKDSGKFIPLPATWLNGERWDDDLASEPQASLPSGGRVVEDSESTKRFLTELRDAAKEHA